jgi:D-glycero-alpha-D-manno-heptose 1-phosphate guanylyltransferase
MKVIILAGGMGTRLKDVVSNVPKPMAPIAGKPFLEYLVHQLRHWGHTDIVLSVGYLKEAITEHFRDGSEWGVSIGYSEEDRPLGTGGAIKNALRLITENECMVLNGDSFCDLNFDEFTKFYYSKASSAAIALTDVQNTARYGRVVVNETGKVSSFDEKGEFGDGLVNCGVYVFPTNIFHAHPSESFSLERDVLTQLTQGALCGFVHKGTFIDIGVPEDYKRAQEIIPAKYQSRPGSVGFLSHTSGTEGYVNHG